MPNFKTHVITGILFYPTYFLLYSFILDIANKAFYPDESIILISFFLFVLGSDLPDVDHKFSLINKIFRILLVGIGIYIVFKIRRYFDFFSFFPFRLYIIKTLYIIIGIILGSLIGILFNYITKHRGKWHSPITGIIIGIIMYILKTNSYYIIDYNALFLSLSLTIGFFVHLFLDFHFKG
ncbi:LexA-binding, inner membrane-associated putative hydrolase [Marinitoga hydrogenitolerans DSM 16785]|uniref:LexA-binding, inner membrane-associated putative hydrolase n=1 Tax=Marinitoga hydrogenitolerans (strain DSM 16785 / JCM 12826 / AT1271) TaxID=1122195 RepID=A0A1M4V318_MARH1|nr:metal-dependent hydrolase [Marinitoga hydrogenitolerans]SHE63273.1 LexA-binding, inner membrane-associated putative hydrolase [Marinitoga hydrogenitolerans DSM 16785]